MRRPRGLSPSKVGPSGFGWPVLGMPMRSPRCDRSSERSRYQRYFSIADWRGTSLYRLAGGHRGVTLVVMSETGSIVGLGNVFPRRRVR